MISLHPQLLLKKFHPSLEKMVPKIGRAHVRTPVTFRNLVCRLLLEKKKGKCAEPYTRRFPAARFAPAGSDAHAHRRLHVGNTSRCRTGTDAAAAPARGHHPSGGAARRG